MLLKANIESVHEHIVNFYSLINLTNIFKHQLSYLQRKSDLFCSSYMVLNQKIIIQKLFRFKFQQLQSVNDFTKKKNLVFRFVERRFRVEP